MFHASSGVEAMIGSLCATYPFLRLRTAMIAASTNVSRMCPPFSVSLFESQSRNTSRDGLRLVTLRLM
jgi:acyl-[acyl carrier protein]--UDP-N-acetylglucosamine O-acyltransferase